MQKIAEKDNIQLLLAVVKVNDLYTGELEDRSFVLMVT